MERGEGSHDGGRRAGGPAPSLTRHRVIETHTSSHPLPHLVARIAITWQRGSNVARPGCAVHGVPGCRGACKRSPEHISANNCCLRSRDGF